MFIKPNEKILSNDNLRQSSIINEIMLVNT